MRKIKILKSILCIVLVCVMGTNTLAGCRPNTPVDEAVAVSGVSLNKNTLTLAHNGSEKLVATVEPENADVTMVTWFSSKPSVATVNGDGLVTAVSAGTTNITVTTVDGEFTDTCAVTVSPIPTVAVTGVTISPKTLNLSIGDSDVLTATIAPANATNTEVLFSSSDSSIIAVNQLGVYNALKDGTATITVTTVDGSFTDTCAVTVNPTPVEGIKLNNTKLIMPLGLGTQTLTATITPANATNKTVIWSSSDSDTVEVVGGVLTAKKITTEPVTITAKSAFNQEFVATCAVTVLQAVAISTAQEFLALNDVFENEYTYLWVDANDNEVSEETVGAKKVGNYNGTRLNGYYYLTNDIDFGGATIRGIGTETRQGDERFEGVFDGRGFALKNAVLQAQVREWNTETAQFADTHVVDSVVWASSFFVHIGVNGVVRNTVFDNIKSHASGHNAIISSLNRGIIENCIIKNSNINSTSTLESGYGVGAAFVTTNNRDNAIIRNIVIQNNISGTYTFAITRFNQKFEAGKTAAGIIENCYIETNNLGNSTLIRNNGETAVNVVAFAKADVSKQNFSALDASVWTLVSNNYPTLKSFVPPVLSITIGGTKVITLNENNSQTKLTATVFPPNASNLNVTWQSLDTSFATVDNTGLVTALKAGEEGASAQVTIKAISVENPSIFAEAVITINAGVVAVTGVEVTPQSWSFKPSEYKQLEANVLPSYASNQIVTWSSSNSDYVAVDAETGVITAIKPTEQGSPITITATTADGNFTDTCIVTVDPIALEGIAMTFSKSTIALGLGGVVLQYTITPANATNGAVTWHSSNESIVTVNGDGLVTAVGVGTATITAKAVEDQDFTTTCTITVLEAVAISSIDEFNAIREDLSIYGTNNDKVVQDDKTAGKYYFLTQDIDFRTYTGENDYTDGTFVSFGTRPSVNSNKVYFNGVFDGRGFAIKNIGNVIAYRYDNGSNASDDIWGKAIFGGLSENAVVKNTIFNNITTTTAQRGAIITTSNAGTIENCSIINCTVSNNVQNQSNSSGSGAIVATDVESTSIIRNIVIDGCSTFGYTSTVAFNVASGAVVQNVFADNDKLSRKYPFSNNDATVVEGASNVNMFAKSALANQNFSALDGYGIWQLNSGAFPTLIQMASPNRGVVSITLSQSTATLNLNIVAQKTIQLEAIIKPMYALNKAVTWSVEAKDDTENADAVTVVNGLVTAVEAGTATVVATTADGGLTAECKVTVESSVVDVASVTIENKEAFTLVAGQTKTLSATVSPANATIQTVTWSSSNTSVATVSASGVVTPVGVGTADIIATSNNASGTNVSDSVAVTVNATQLPTPPKTFSSNSSTASEYNNNPSNAFCYDRFTNSFNNNNSVFKGGLVGLASVRVYVYTLTTASSTAVNSLAPETDATLIGSFLIDATNPALLTSLDGTITLNVPTSNPAYASDFKGKNYFINGDLFVPFIKEVFPGITRSTATHKTFAFFKVQFIAEENSLYSNSDITTEFAMRCIDIKAD